MSVHSIKEFGTIGVRWSGPGCIVGIAHALGQCHQPILRPASSLEMDWFHGDLPYRGFSLSPDGKSFMTSAPDMQGDILLLENFDQRQGVWDRVLRR